MVIAANFSYGHRTLANLLSVDADKRQLAEEVKHLGLWVHNDLTLHDRKMYFYVHMFRRLSKVLFHNSPTYSLNRLMTIYMGYDREGDLDRIQRI